MAAKNANLARDYADGRMFLVDQLKAQFTATAIARAPTVRQPLAYILEVGTFSAGVTYRMRGFETVLMKHVFWNSAGVDSTGANYPGDSGNLTDVGVQRIIGG